MSSDPAASVADQPAADEAASSSVDAALLPETYDRLVHVDQLVHGAHNPRQIPPSDRLRRSVRNTGLTRPLIVRPDSDPAADVYHITDGWQRYQAATDCGWEQLPVTVYATPLESLQATEGESIVTEWSTYEWAQFCRSVATEVGGDSRQERIERVVETIDGERSVQTVRRYLDVLSLPDAVHPLLVDGPAGTDQDWMALENYVPNIRQYSGLPLKVAAPLARRQESLPYHRVIGIAAIAATFQSTETAIEFIEAAADRPETALELLQEEVLMGTDRTQYLKVPRTRVRMGSEKREAIMDYCVETRRSLSEIIAEKLTQLAEEVTE